MCLKCSNMVKCVQVFQSVPSASICPWVPKIPKYLSAAMCPNAVICPSDTMCLCISMCLSVLMCLSVPLCPSVPMCLRVPMCQSVHLWPSVPIYAIGWEDEIMRGWEEGDERTRGWKDERMKEGGFCWQMDGQTLVIVESLLKLM